MMISLFASLIKIYSQYLSRKNVQNGRLHVPAATINKDFGAKRFPHKNDVQSVADAW